MPIEVWFAYYRGNGRWTREVKKFKNEVKAAKFIHMLKTHPKMVFMELHCDDPYDDWYIRGRCGL